MICTHQKRQQDVSKHYLKKLANRLTRKHLEMKQRSEERKKRMAEKKKSENK